MAAAEEVWEEAAAAHVDASEEGALTTIAAANRAVIDRGDDDAPPADLIDSTAMLELSHCRLRQIDLTKAPHTPMLINLTRLRLDNNSITVMENLAPLVHLTWLDLSFNQIERISGLESLTRLTDLSLYHNRIHDVRGLATAGCQGLQYLSLGRNHLDLTAPSALLRVLADRFPALEALVLHGQSAEDEAAAPDTTTTAIGAAVVAVLPCLQYLDHKLLATSGIVGA